MKNARQRCPRMHWTLPLVIVLLGVAAVLAALTLVPAIAPFVYTVL